MKIAYILIAHKNPAQVARLIDSLEFPEVSFYLHIDSRVNIKDFSILLSNHPNLVWLKREKSLWGSFGLAQAILNGLTEVNRHEPDVDYIVNLTGQDYPIKSNRYILNFFTENSGTNYMEHFPMPAVRWKDGGMQRLEKYYFEFLGERRIYPFPYVPLSFKNRLLEKILLWYLPYPRDFPRGLQPFGGSALFCLTREAVQVILEFIKTRPDVIRFYRYCFIPEEMIFHTILLNSSTMKGKILNDDCRFIHWEGKASPEILTSDMFTELVNSPKLFARKFDMNVDENILNLIDERILES